MDQKNTTAPQNGTENHEGATFNNSQQVGSIQGGVEPHASNSKHNIGMAIVAYIIFFLPLLTDAKNDPFVKFHVKQGLVLSIMAIIAWFVGWIPVIGMILYMLLVLCVLILLVIGIVNAATGKQKELPIIGKFAKNFNF